MHRWLVSECSSICLSLVLIYFICRIVPFEDVSIEDFPAGSVVFINQKMRQFLIEAFNYRPPDVFESIPPRWEQLWSEGPCSLYRVPLSSTPEAVASLD